MIIEFTLAIILAVFILAYLPEILALGAIVLAIGVVVAVLAGAAFLATQYPAYLWLVVLVLGAACGAYFYWRHNARLHYSSNNTGTNTNDEPQFWTAENVISLILLGLLIWGVSLY